MAEYGKKWDLNRASRNELMSVSGISPEAVDGILNYRKEHEFESVDELRKVPGIKSFDNLRDSFTVARTDTTGEATD
jgi:competence protein ComEA